MAKGESKATLEMLYGQEPIWTSDKEISDTDLMGGYYWYRNVPTDKEKKEWFLKYAKDSCTKKELSELKTIPDYRFVTVGPFVRMIERGAIMPERNTANFTKIVNGLREYVNHDSLEKKEVAKDKKISVQDHITNAVNKHTGKIESEIDNFISGGFKSKFSMHDYLKENDVKGLIANKISLNFVESEKELGELIRIWDIKTDAYNDFKESWSCFTKDELCKYRDFVASIIIDCSIISSNKKRSAKPRKHKAPNLQKLVANVNYLKNDSKLKLESLHPIKIIKADEVWVWNQKIRKIGIYYSKDTNGLSIKGSTIQNFDDKSTCKTVRKPEEYFEKIIQGGKRVFKNAYKDIKAKESNLTGRLNKDTLIVKVF